MKTTIQTFLCCVLLICASGLHAQDFSKNSIKFGLGLGVSSSNQTEGLGMAYSFGYQHQYWDNRLRLNPSFSIGHYSSRFVMDYPDEFFNSITIETNIQVDAIRYKAFSLYAGIGIFANNSRGFKGASTWYDMDSTYTSPARYISDYYGGVNLIAGLRINPAHSRIAINLSPVNIRLGWREKMMEGCMKIEVDIKLDKKE